jgi:putative addiction module component (TIGR02574 family)
MSFSEIKAGIADLSIEERLELAALIAHLNRAEDPAWQAELDRRLNAMESGRKHGQSEIQKRHQELSGR